MFVDVDERTFNLDAAKLEEAVRFVERETDLVPRVVVAVDLFGLPADYPAIRKVCERHGLLLLEDGAQGFGGSIDGRMACSFGDVSTTSFFPAKPLGCYGDGGAVFTDSDEWAELVRSYAVHGKGSMKYDNVRVGVNSRLDTLQAAVLLATAPKSNSVYQGIAAAMADVKAGRVGDIPRELQNVHADSAGLEREQGYLYPHDFPGHWVRQQYLPDELKNRKYYQYSDNKTEQAARRYWDEIKKP